MKSEVDTGQELSPRPLMRMKQWLNLASKFGRFSHFDAVKHSASVGELYTRLTEAMNAESDQALAKLGA